MHSKNKFLNELQNIKKYVKDDECYRKQIKDSWDYEYDIKKQKELQDLIEKFYQHSQEAARRKNVCLLCGEEVPSHPMVCQDCKRVFAAFKSILVAENEPQPA